MSIFMMLFRKACHLQVEIEHKALWAITSLNFDLDKVREEKMLHLYKTKKNLGWKPTIK